MTEANDNFTVLDEAARMLIAASDGEGVLQMYRGLLERLLIEQKIDPALASTIAEKFVWAIVQRANELSADQPVQEQI